MCGRYKIVSLSDYVNQFPKFEELFSFKPRYNVALSQLAPIVRLNREDKPTISLVKWGLIPHWTKGKPKQQPCNARSETVATSPIFRKAFERRRCLVLADGFYEWKGSKPKIPFLIHMRDKKAFAFAGLWERWQNENGEAEDTFTILTTTPNELLASIHNRMPVILKSSDYEKWLDRKTDLAEVAALLKPFPAELMEAFPVSTKINNARVDEPGLLVPAEPESPFTKS